MSSSYRTHVCGELTKQNVGASVRLAGWVNRIRDHGGLLFIDLRDHYGITQIVCSPESPVFALAETLRAEWVICVHGKVRARSPETINPKMPTGHIEIPADNIEILSIAADLPVPVFGEPDYPEDIRLKYRFLDLRRETLHKNIVARSHIIESMRSHMRMAGFTEYTTPILTASSPEGARDFIVPSRIHPGKFFALPQAPQQYKQLIMIAGFDRYFQIAPCFRDEDPRADRLPGEFYQLDLEMSFVTQDDVLRTIEPIIRNIFVEFGEGKLVPDTFARIPYDTALRKYASDKPDLRNPIEFSSVSEHFAGSGFGVFSNMLATDPSAAIWALPAKGGASRAFCDSIDSWAKTQGQPGLGYIFWRNSSDPHSSSEGAGPIAKNLGPERTQAIASKLGLDIGDACFFIAGRPDVFMKFASIARDKVAHELGLVSDDSFHLCWITDFPMYEWNPSESRVDFCHNPFSMPQGGLDALNNQDPLSIKAAQYDLVCNGYEIASGSIRNHSLEVMLKVFEVVGFTQEDVATKFGALYNAFQYGAPPHGGMAAGIDRIVMLLLGAKNLRDVTMFPMNQRATDLLMGAPSELSPQQLRELHIRVSAI